MSIYCVYLLCIYKYKHVVTVHTAGRDEEHADEDILQNNSL